MVKKTHSDGTERPFLMVSHSLLLATLSLSQLSAWDALRFFGVALTRVVLLLVVPSTAWELIRTGTPSSDQNQLFCGNI